ncbi:MAG: site-specific DNA-methyltransferase [Chloroflexales bacterium]|nr:site-specific DNA-methyltransferase [Chloroflexales bacterium]
MTHGASPYNEIADEPQLYVPFSDEAASTPGEIILDFPAEDNTPEGLQAFLKANALYRKRPWPTPFDTTTHRLKLGDARDLSWINDESVDLVVTSPPYWNLKKYKDESEGQMGDIDDYETFLEELDKVWHQCAQVLVGGGRICCWQ